MTSRRTFALATVGALVAAGLAAAPQTANAASRRSVPRTAATWTARAHKLGPAGRSSTATFRVYLAPRGGLGALKQDVAARNDPSSRSYRHFLSAAQYHARFDAPASSVKAVSSYLRGQHLSITSVEAHHRYLAVKGSVGNVQRALGTTLNRYRHNGTTVRANAGAVTLPTSVAPYVTTVTGLDTTPHKVTHDAKKAAPFPDGFRNARPCSADYGDTPATAKADGTTPLPQFNGKTLPYAVCGYTGPQLRGAYEGGNDLTGGRGTTVAITDAYASPTIASDASTYATEHGDGRYGSGQLTQVTPKRFTRQQTCGSTGWWGEETLDVEAVHAMAPGANIRYYASASCFDEDFLVALARVVDDNSASLVSNSWSDLEINETPAGIAAYEQIFLQGAEQGIGFLFSSGDDGDEAAGGLGLQVDYPASDPYATAVGGTADAIDGSGFRFQTGWGTEKYTLSSDGTQWSDAGYLYGAGGGLSSQFPRPDYQRGVVPDSYGSTRAVPDVGLDADPTTGMLVGQTQRFGNRNTYDEYRIGGTSLASPLFAGLTAAAQRSAVTADNPEGRLGFLNPLIYSQRSSSFKDINGSPDDAGNVRADYANGVDASAGILYTVRTFNQDSSLKTAPGWDNVTGVGSPTPAWLTAGATP